MLDAQKLDRRIFATSRLAEFTSIKELTAQTGYAPDSWPQVIVKELVDNAIDDTEKTGIAPEIEIAVDAGRIVVTDNGGGIAPEIVASILDYQSRTSDKEAYVSPTRGAQGNALKTLLAMPFALDGTMGRTVIESRGIRHQITFAIDPVRREPRIEHSTEPSLVKNGTRVTVHLPGLPWSEEEPTGWRFFQVGRGFAALNPHLALKVMDLQLACTDPAWTKWTPADPIPAHWYRDDRFDRLIAAHIADDQDRGRNTTVREFIATFRGMSATVRQKAVLESSGAARISLADFYANGRNREAVNKLLCALQESTKPVKPADLGVIGRDHIEAHFAKAGAEMGSFEYVRQTGETRAGLPFVLEVAFAWCPDGVEEVGSSPASTSHPCSPTRSGPSARMASASTRF
jgi:DNA topoisomerase VI subunit B